MRVLICGDREWTGEIVMREVLEVLLSAHKDLTIIQGEARGADLMARRQALNLGIDVEGYPANWEKYKKAAGPIRNRKMLDQRIDRVIAFHSDIENSKGTKDCVTEAKRRGIPVQVVS